MSAAIITRKAAAGRGCAAVLFGLYTVMVARLTLAPASSESAIFGLLDLIMAQLSGGRLQWSQTEVLANVALFVPAGFLLAIVLGRSWASVVLCIVFAAGIELAQQRYLPSRVPSVADVEHNALGAIIGAAVAWPINRVLTR